jgi:hypothetical protein
MTAARRRCARLVEEGSRLNEQQIQIALIGHLKYRLAPGVWFCAIPNGGYRRPIEAKLLQGQGVRAGAPDLLFVKDGLAYVDPNTGDLRIWASDAAFHSDAELRIPAEDVDDFLNGLAELVGREPLLEQNSPKPSDNLAAGDLRPQPLSGAERVRRHRERKRNGCNEGNDENVTGNAPALLEELGGDE